MSGGPGTGKSFLIGALTSWALDSFGPGSVRLAAPTGTAAANIGGRTLHSLLNLKTTLGDNAFASYHNPTSERYDTSINRAGSALWTDIEDVVLLTESERMRQDAAWDGLPEVSTPRRTGALSKPAGLV